MEADAGQPVDIRGPIRRQMIYPGEGGGKGGRMRGRGREEREEREERGERERESGFKSTYTLSCHSDC